MGLKHGQNNARSCRRAAEQSTSVRAGFASTSQQIERGGAVQREKGGAKFRRMTRNDVEVAAYPDMELPGLGRAEIL